MSNRLIYILSAEIQQGKTTALQNWMKNRENVFGILTPVIERKRFFLNTATNEKFEMEATTDGESILEVGRFKFSQKAFERATDILHNAGKQDKGWVIIDEVGPLELRKEGLHDAINHLLSNKESQQNIILVVRKPLLQDVIDFYNINRNEIVLLDLSSDFFNH